MLWIVEPIGVYIGTILVLVQGVLNMAHIIVDVSLKGLQSTGHL